MKQIVLIFASVYGMLAVVLGAFASHLLKNVLSEDKLHSFEIGIKYQMYNAIVLLILGFYFSFENTLEKSMAISFILGTLLFSVSIYLLSFQEFWKVNLKFLGPITPLGGLLMIIGWVLLLVIVIKRF